MAPHSSTLAWKIPWTEGQGRLQTMGSLRVRHDWATSLSCIGEGNGNPLQCSCLENPRDGGAWWAAVSGVTRSRTRLKRLSSSLIYISCRSILSSLAFIQYQSLPLYCLNRSHLIYWHNGIYFCHFTFILYICHLFSSISLCFALQCVTVF